MALNMSLLRQLDMHTYEEPFVRNEKVAGSIPVGSTIPPRDELFGGWLPQFLSVTAPVASTVSQSSFLISNFKF